MAISLIRHGETAWNAAKIVQYPDTPLNPRGLEQAQRVGKRMASLGITAILSSDYARARSTAEAMREHTGVALEFEPLLRERHFGAHRGKSMAEIGFDIFAQEHAPPEGEDWPMFRSRVSQAWQAMQAFAASRQGDVAVVSHGLVIRALVDTLPLTAGLNRADAQWGNTCVTVIERAPEWEITSLASSTHLEDSDVADGGHPVGI